MSQCPPEYLNRYLLITRKPMDPNTALSSLRTSLEASKKYHGATRLAALERIAETAEDLDGWLSRGGFLPSAWVPEMGREVK